MKAEPRYAIYFAPPPDTPIWAFGSAVLGHDAASGKNLPGFEAAGLAAAEWSALTAQPRVYGFHATLKAPFHLASVGEDGLQGALRAFCAARSAFRLGPMAVTAVASSVSGLGFVALTPKSPPPALATLERDVVVEFDSFRRPLTREDRARRDPERLSDRQRRNLDDYGYPFVLEDFRFHMTLTGATANAADIADALAERLANDVGTVDLAIDGLCLFRQEKPQQHFRIVGLHPFRP